MFKLLFHRKKSHKQNVAEKEIPSTSHQSIPDACVAENGQKKKRKWRHLCCSSQTDSDAEAESNTVKTQKKCRWFLFKFWKKLHKQNVAEKEIPSTSHQSVACGGKKIESQTGTIDCFGFPNIGNKRPHDPEAQLLRRLIDVRDCHESTDYGLKDHHLRAFKKAFSSQAPEYTGSAQKDAHEFLTLFLDEVKRLTPHLERNAALLGQSYSCPVEDHHIFKMENMRTCKSCGHQSSQQEEFTSLSLDLFRGVYINIRDN
uniref:ubiquitin carboxyl-terminal hydrolase 29-like n=1 Tax=Maylandia zebra TaxID=106582 RepID=UPI000D319591|nr:ubiquitin carboxyl-terminal hydrolase 29-like [Maylandia zebra]